ncbi:YegP family protein (plasmid) [Streptosporangium sp. CA-135522]|uniref:YegP family protein n=1 Tax=Streptosporangium sp. CA-135522 TaxID=3240072 RepID=UPI003D8ADD0E
MAARYVLKKTSAGFRFNLVAGNGEIIATSESYTTKASALKGIDAVRANAASPVDDQTSA